MTRIDVINLMESSLTEDEWNQNCDRVKNEFGDYPEWWYKEIVLSGVATRTSANFGKKKRFSMTEWATNGSNS